MRQVNWWSVAMFTRHEVISSRWSSHFWAKMYVFQLLSGIKVKPVDKMMQSKYLCVLLHVKRKKLLLLTVFTSSLILDKIQDAWRPYLVTSQTSSSATTHKIYLNLWRKSKAFHWRLNLFEILQRIYQRRKGEGPSPPCITVGVWFCVYVRGLIAVHLHFQRSIDITISLAFTRLLWVRAACSFPHFFS